MGALFTADGLIALVTLTAMEIVLGIDNIVFIAILVGRLPTEQQRAARAARALAGARSCGSACCFAISGSWG